MKNIVITGATKGIGHAIAVKFATEGNRIFICSRNEEDLKATATFLEATHPDTKVFYLEVDLMNKPDVLLFAQAVLEKFDAVDILVNNAGHYLPGTTLSEADGLLEDMLNAHLFSAYHLSRKILPAMIPKKSGHIFNICSIASFMAYPNGGAYTIAKFALLGFTKVLRSELKDQGIKVTAIMPGATWSNSWEGADFPKERLMLASDIAQAVYSATLMSPSAVVEEIIIRPQLGDL